MTRLLIARHGNTFGSSDTPVRIGRQTDLPLVESGKTQAVLLGKLLKENYPSLEAVYSGDLKRSIETASIVLQTVENSLKIIKSPIFDEIDYALDEGKTEEEVVSRIGKRALEAWNQNAIVPSGWNVNPDEIIQNWHNFAQMVCEKYPGGTVLVITSNGIARFAPHLTGDIEKFKQKYAIKISTGALCSLVKEDKKWRVECWNIRPQL